MSPSGTEIADEIHVNMASVCAMADALFDGTNARFVLVVWPEGFESDPDSMAIFALPEAMEVAQTALATASTAKLGGEVLQ